MEELIYADLIGDIAVSNGMVRMELYEEFPRPPAPDGSQPPPEYKPRRRLVMPLAGFARCYPLFASLLRQLARQGVIITDQEGQAPSPEGESNA
jgi:hypothetical protein